MFICTPKINFVTHFLLEIKEPCNFIGQIWNINLTILVFILDYFQENVKSKFLKKYYSGGILSPFCQNLGKNEFFWKRGLWSVFKYSNYLPPCKKSGKTNDPFLRKMPNWPTNRQTHRQRWFYRTLYTKKYTQDKVHPFMTRKNYFEPCSKSVKN